MRTVAGQEVWRGRATGLVDSQPSALARIDIPAERLRADDYIVELLDVETSVRETDSIDTSSECEANGPRICLEEAEPSASHRDHDALFRSARVSGTEAAERLRGA